MRARVGQVWHTLFWRVPLPFPGTSSDPRAAPLLPPTACKDFCIHRVKLAHGRGVTVHDLFASEEDETRLRRYAALTKAGVVWEQVARRQHYARKRNTKRRRPSASSASSVSSASSSRSAPVSRKRRRPSAASAPSSNTKPRRVSCRARRKPSTLSEYVDDAGSVTSHDSGDSVGSAATDAAHDTTVSAAAASAVSPARAAAGAGAVVATPSQFCHYVPSAAPVPALEVGPSAQWPMFRDFDEAVDALVGGQDLGASNVSLDEFTSVVSQLDAASPPLFDDDNVGDGVGVPRLMLDVAMLDTLSSHDWDRVFMSPHATVPQQSSAPLTVCM